MAGTVMTPSVHGGNAFRQIWSKTIHGALYERWRAINRWRTYEPVEGQLTVRLYQRATALALAASSDGTGLSASNIIGTPVTLSPGAIYCLLEYPRHFRSRLDYSPGSRMTQEIENAMMEDTEATALTAVSSLLYGHDALGGVSAADWRKAQGALRVNSRGMIQPGQTEVYGLFHGLDYENISGIPEFVNAEIRGDGSSPHARGIFVKAQGVTFDYSTAIYVDPATSARYNVIWHPDAFGIGWNEKTNVEEQTDEAQVRLLAFNDSGSGIVRHELAYRIRTS